MLIIVSCYVLYSNKRRTSQNSKSCTSKQADLLWWGHFRYLELFLSLIQTVSFSLIYFSAKRNWEWIIKTEWPNVSTYFLNYMHGLKSAILAIFQKGLGWLCLLVWPSKMHHSIWKILFVLGADEYLERLEGKIRKCLFFYVKIF